MQPVSHSCSFMGFRRGGRWLMGRLIVVCRYRMPVLALAGAIVCQAVAVAQEKNLPYRPNVILILADDMCIGDLSSMNGGISRTPVLDDLKSQSVWFNQAYSASAVCAPARASLLTGRYPHRTGVVTLDMKRFPTLTNLGSEEVTVADVFREHGYYTGMIGKWHVGTRPESHPMKRGFQEFAGFRGFDVQSYFRYRLDINGKFRDYDGKYLTDELTEQAVSFVNRHKGSPFFLHLAYYAPHRPLGAPGELVQYYRARGLNDKTATIYAMIEVMDRGIGRVLSELDRLGLRENTLVIFASDNGPDPLTGERFNMNFSGQKYSVNEGGIRVPMLFHWKGKLKPMHINGIAHFTDVLPTLADICQLSLSPERRERLDGSSLSAVLSGGSGGDSSIARYWQWNRGVPYYTHNAAMRQGNWKILRPMLTTDVVESESTLKPMLFDLSRDSAESTDVSAGNPKVYERMKVMLEDWCRKVEADRLKATSTKNY